jgi:DNA-binding CsgD family transcriptional regulator
MAKMNWTRVSKERQQRDHVGGGGRAISDTELARRARKRKKGKATSAKRRSRVNGQHKPTFADGARSWFEHSSRQAVKRLHHEGLSETQIATQLGISIPRVRAHLAALNTRDDEERGGTR